jgi:hypothetical protein
MVDFSLGPTGIRASAGRFVQDQGAAKPRILEIYTSGGQIRAWKPPESYIWRNFETSSGQAGHEFISAVRFYRNGFYFQRFRF